MKRILFASIVILIISSCSKDDLPVVDSRSSFEFNHKIPLIWNQMFLEMERFSPGYRPPVSARNHAYINLAAYEAAVQGSRGSYKSFSGVLPDLIVPRPAVGKDYNWEACVNAAYEHAFELFFPIAPAEQQFKMIDLSHALKADLQTSMEYEVYQRSVDFGQSVAQAIYEWSILDTWGHEAYLKNNDPSYSPTTGIDKWKPTYPDYSPALLPHWGKVRTFAAQFGDIAPPPPVFNTQPGSQLYNEAIQTMSLVNEIKLGNLSEELWIAEFWSDDCPILTFTPAGRWVSITNQLVGIERLDLMETVATYAKIGMAISDAGVKCWKEKYRYNMLRPIDFIREHMHESDWNTVMCPDGSGGYYTPNFPTYPSGHATFAGAASKVLESVFGTNYTFTDRSHEGRKEFRGNPRKFSSFREMAEENGYSRVPLGVHFISDSEAGLGLGYVIGERVVDLPWN